MFINHLRYWADPVLDKNSQKEAIRYIISKKIQKGGGQTDGYAENLYRAAT